MNPELYFWIAFILIFIIGYFVDMRAAKHRHKEVSISTALKWTGVWISIAFLFGLAISLFYPQNENAEVHTRTMMGMKFYSAYLTEYMLSVDNLFVFIMIFSMMKVRGEVQPVLLKYGILLSMVFRTLFILVGMGLVNRFEWLIYLFGAFLIFMTFRMIKSGDDEETIDPEKNALIRAAKRIFRVDVHNHKPKFHSRVNGKFAITPFALTFLLIGSTDVMFAVDSVPAVIGVIQEGNQALTLNESNFLAISSNTFALMGLVSLFFALKGIMKLFRHLKTGICFILFFVGAKMILCAFDGVSKFFSDHSWVSFTVILSTLAISILYSVVENKIGTKRQG
ncbi:MAG: TerC/Alx family metal homeostasis membrane protein [Bacteroidales bacterium]